MLEEAVELARRVVLLSEITLSESRGRPNPCSEPSQVVSGIRYHGAIGG